jgi:hypothetical protein
LVAICYLLSLVVLCRCRLGSRRCGQFLLMLLFLCGARLDDVLRRLVEFRLHLRVDRLLRYNTILLGTVSVGLLRTSTRIILYWYITLHTSVKVVLSRRAAVRKVGHVVSSIELAMGLVAALTA